MCHSGKRSGLKGAVSFRQKSLSRIGLAAVFLCIGVGLSFTASQGSKLPFCKRYLAVVARGVDMAEKGKPGVRDLGRAKIYTVTDCNPDSSKRGLLRQSYARPTTVLRDELYSGSF